MMNHTIRTIAAIAFAFALLLTAQAQPLDRKRGETGLPFVTWFSPQEYGASQQIWSFAQDDRGILYAGCNSGVLEYDGVSWRRIATPHSSVVRTMTQGPGGRIFVGEVGDFGYLEPDKNGEMKYRSLLEFVPKEERDFQDVVEIHSMPEGIYVHSRERLFRLTMEGQSWRVKSWKPATIFRNSFVVFGMLHISVAGVGLFRMTGEALENLALPGLEQNIDNSITIMLPFSEEGAASRQILLATREGALYLLEAGGLRPFVAEAAALLRSLKTASVGATLRDGAFALGTRTGGLLLMERTGKTRRYLEQTAGIPADGVLGIFIDRTDALWLGLQNGIAKVEASSPFSEFARAAGMSSAVNDIVRFRGALYVGTLTGLKKLEDQSGEFNAVEPSRIGTAFGLLNNGESLLVAAGRDGLFEIRESGLRPVTAKVNLSYYSMARSRQNPNRIWLTTDNGLAAIRWDGAGNWIDEGVVAKGPVLRTITEPEPGQLWLGTESMGVLRVRFEGDSLQNPRVERFGKVDGLPSDGGIDAILIAGRQLFVSPAGIREFDPAGSRFIPSKTYGSLPAGAESGGSNQSAAPQGNIWVQFGLRPILLLRQSDGTYKIDESRMRRLRDKLVTWIFADEDGVVWLGGADRIFRYDPRRARNDSENHMALVRRVTAGETEKIVLYAGASGITERPSTSIAYRNNELRFEYASSSLEDPTRNQYQTMLEGFDHDWSAWTLETRRDYTNLPPGSYRFRVKALNALGQAGTEAEYRLTILPPWYRTWWAYGLYALLVAAGVFATDRILRSRVVAREREKSALREAQLRAETAAAEARTLQAENERNKNVELLSEIGKELTSSLDLDTIFFRLYEHVNQLMDASIFGVGIHHPERHEIEYRLAMENGKRYEPYSRDTRDRNQFPVWCIEHRQPIFINDVAAEYAKYIARYEEPAGNLEDGATSIAHAASMIYLPLMMKDRVLGVITVQSFKRNAYSAHHLDLLENLAAYTSIALDNADSYTRLKSAQEQLVVQEKLASLGALTAGIAHEIKNPLNFINNYADLSVELMTELREELEQEQAALPEKKYQSLQKLIGSLSGNAKKIFEHGKRADGIVRSMLLHSRGQAGERQPTDINAMLDEYVNLSYHGMRAQDSSFNLTIERDFDPEAGAVDAIPQDLSRVFLNLLNNACYAVNEKARLAGPGFAPTLRVHSRNLGDSVEVRIRDNGMGIPAEVRDKIFNPFFTTKPTGQGTGLGLSISHDIVVQGHGGQLEVETVPGEFTEFVVRLPRQERKAG